MYLAAYSKSRSRGITNTVSGNIKRHRFVVASASDIFIRISGF